MLSVYRKKKNPHASAPLALILQFFSLAPQRITERQNRVSIADRMWARLLSSTNQPSFLCNEVIEEARREHERAALLLDGSPSHRKLEERLSSSKSSGKK
jgi:6-phosphofructokinase 1